MNSSWRDRQFKRSGTFRKERVQPFLWPDRAPIDQRDLQELLEYVLKLSEHIPFYDLNNQLSAHKWNVFFRNDMSFILAMIAVFDLKSAERKLLEFSLKFNQATDDTTRSALLESFETETMLLIATLQNWYDHGQVADSFSDQFEILKVLKQTEEKIWDDWNDWEKSKSLPLNNEAAAGNSNDPVLSRIKGLISTQNESNKENERAPRIRFVYRLIYRAVNSIVEFARSEFSQTLANDRHAPQAALLISFLKLFQHSQHHLNEYTKRHLDYYYYRVLGEREKKAESDYAYLRIELGEHIDRLVLPAGTRFFSHINSSGRETLYENRSDIELNQVRVKNCKTLFVERDPDVDLGSSFLLTTGVFVAEDALSEDGKGKAFTTGNQSWPTFGEIPANNPQRKYRTAPAQLGLAISSHLLLLGSGQRNISLSFYFQTVSFGRFRRYIEDISLKKSISIQTVLHQLFSKAFDISLSSTDAWLEQLPYKLQAFSNDRGEGLKLEIALSETVPPIAPASVIHQGMQLETKWPTLKLMLRPEEHIFVYSFLEMLQLEEIDLAVQVEGLKDIQLFNEFGQLNSASPFFPFGPMPKRRSYLLFGNTELRTKKLDHLEVHIDWFDLPDQPGGFSTYYEHYPPGMDTADFKINLSALSNNTFWPYRPEERQNFNLFQDDDTKKLVRETHLQNIQVSKLAWMPEYTPSPLPDYTTNSRNGYFRLELTAPDEAFGHSIYPKLFADYAIRNARKPTGLTLFPSRKKGVDMPNEPYTPKINQLKVDYRSSERIKFNPRRFKENNKSTGDKVFLLHPFGYEESYQNGMATSDQFLPSYRENGNLFIGLEGLKPFQVVSLYFKLTGIKTITPFLAVSQPQFFYLSYNRWISFAPEDILTDGTQSFTTSGILTLRMPKDAALGNTILDNQLSWIRISLEENADKIGETQYLCTNATQVFWVVDPQLPNHFWEVATRPFIKELSVQQNAVSKITQLSPYTGGKPAEDQAQFYARMSERLRHKNRALNQWDFEHLVLEQFPEIIQVKCIGYNQYRPFLESGEKDFAAGQLVIVIVPQIDPQNNEIAGDAHLLDRVRKFLLQKSSPFADIRVIFPVVERVRINGLVRFKSTENTGLLLERLHQELKYFLCPWQDGGPFPLGEEINIYELYRFIESLPFVAFFTQFSVIHLSATGNVVYQLWDSSRQEKSSVLIQPRQPWSTLIPLDLQGIRVTDRDIDQMPERLTLDKMYIDSDLVIQDPSQAEDD